MSRPGREEVTGANVLVAMFAERESHAAYFLQEQNITRFDGPGWGIWGPVHYIRDRLIRDRLAFMKAEFEISNAQEQLWEAFAEALRDFLKARSRPDIGGPVGTAGLPERLAMRERDLTSDLESLRQRKAIIETFYAG
jgi:hypothetical protein